MQPFNNMYAGNLIWFEMAAFLIDFEDLILLRTDQRSTSISGALE